MRCLQIDHIIPLKKVDNSQHGIQLWRRIIKGEKVDNIQVLCANCHAIKTSEGDKHKYTLTGAIQEKVEIQKK